MLVERPIENFYKVRWLEKYLFGHSGFIAGGCFKNLFSDEKLKDIDVFFRNETDYVKAEMFFDALCG